MNNKKRIIIIAVSIVVIIGAIFLWLILRNSQNRGTGNQSQTAGQKSTFQERTETIKDLLAQKLSQPVDNITVNISRETESYSKGIVNIIDQSANPAKVVMDGIYLAIKINGTWKIIWDGNGQYTCAGISSYNFPAEMVNDCQK